MNKIPDSYKEAIKQVHSKLTNSSIEWYITGKTNLALQGIDVRPSQLGILIHDKDLQNFLNLFNDFEKSEIIELENGEAKEFMMKIGDVQVLVCAEYDHGTYWQVFKEPVLLDLEDIKLPCFNLESDKEAYICLGMLEKAEIIDNWIKNKKKES